MVGYHGGRYQMSKPPREYGFNERLEMSQGYAENVSISDIILSNIPSACSVHQASISNDKSGTDWWVETQSGNFLSIDAKVRSEDWRLKGQDDLALETWSVIENNKVGWSRDKTKRTDYILWLWQDTGRWCLIPFQMLCGVFIDHWENWKVQYKCKQQKTQYGDSYYHSECVFVPRDVLWREIYKRYSGHFDTS